jgi:CelD/BcsL family acetyltransferase involved in cellulose biosynthesis
VSAVRCNGEPIGIEVSFACKERVFGHVIAYDTAFRRQGVGSILANYSIRTAREQGFTVFDMLPPGDAHKVALADGTVAVEDWAVPISRKGKIYVRLWLSVAFPWLKKAIGGMPIGLRRKLSNIHRRSLLASVEPASRAV